MCPGFPNILPLQGKGQPQSSTPMTQRHNNETPLEPVDDHNKVTQNGKTLNTNLPLLEDSPKNHNI